LVSFQATFALTLCKLVQFYTYIFALVCVGINHQKGGDRKGNRVKPFPKQFWWLNCLTQTIGLTSLLYNICSTGAKGSQQTNTKLKERVQIKGAKTTEGCPGLAHRTVWCATGQCPVHHRTVSGAPGRSTPNLPPSGFWKLLSAIIHRTVRCSTGLSGVPSGATATAPTVDCKSEQCELRAQSQSRRQKAHRTVNSDCPVARLSEAPTVEP
jgi:hypothetical protein